MQYVEVLIADSKYRGDEALTYHSELEVHVGSVVTIPLRARKVTGFVHAIVNKPDFATKKISSVQTTAHLPAYSLTLAEWVADYYATSYGEALRLFAPQKPSVRKTLKHAYMESSRIRKDLMIPPLTEEQTRAVQQIKQHNGHSLLLHGETGSGKTRVYIELAQEELANNKSVIMLTPEIGLTAQFVSQLRSSLPIKPIVLHSGLSAARRKQLWKQIIEAKTPQLIIGPRSALFAPIQNLGLIIVDEAHDQSYKQDQAPRYNALRVASKLAELSNCKVIFGSATPQIADYFVANGHQAIVRMSESALKQSEQVEVRVIDLKDSSMYSSVPFLSQPLLDGIKQTLAQKQQVLLFLNRRGSARLIMCDQCGWQLLCSQCDVPMTYHADSHQAICHTCGLHITPPHQCPECANPDISYKSIGTKAVAESIARFFPEHSVKRFDSDNQKDETLEKMYEELQKGSIDIIVGTQTISKGFDLPKLGMVGIVVADTSLFLPDYTADERTFQLLYQTLGRIGRGHGAGRAFIQTYDPQNPTIIAAITKDWASFYENAIDERRQFRYPPFSYLLKLHCKRATQAGAQQAAEKLALKLIRQYKNENVQIIGPAPSFIEKRGGSYYWQIIIKAKDRKLLVEIARNVPSGWTIDLDPQSLL